MSMTQYLSERQAAVRTNEVIEERYVRNYPW